MCARPHARPCTWSLGSIKKPAAWGPGRPSDASTAEALHLEPFPTVFCVGRERRANTATAFTRTPIYINTTRPAAMIRHTNIHTHTHQANTTHTHTRTHQAIPTHPPAHLPKGHKRGLLLHQLPPPATDVQATTGLQQRRAPRGQGQGPVEAPHRPSDPLLNDLERAGVQRGRIDQRQVACVWIDRPAGSQRQGSEQKGGSTRRESPLPDVPAEGGTRSKHTELSSPPVWLAAGDCKAREPRSVACIWNSDGIGTTSPPPPQG